MITADVAMSECWLAPRLAALQKTFQDIDIELVSSDDPESYLAPSIDIAIVHGQGDWPGYQSVLLFTEEVIPVCSPSYLEKHGPINQATDLLNASLIDLIYEKWTWMNWTIWLSESDMPHSGINRVFRSNHYGATMQAAKDGMGIALGWRYFVDPDLLDLSLVSPVSASVKTTNGYYLLLNDRNQNIAEINRIAEWIQAAFKNQPLF